MIMKSTRRFGLALSGGGYRAAAFHLGTFRALHRMGLLPRVDVLSTISGGSIVGGAYAMSDPAKYDIFDKQMVKALSEKSVIRFVLLSHTSTIFFGGIFLVLSACAYLLFTEYAWTTLPILFLLGFCIIRFQFRLFPVSKEIERAYNKFYFNNKSLKDLPLRPELVIGSTNLQTSTPFVFSKRKMEDSNYRFRKGQKSIEFVHHEFPIARAVVASSCVPFAFTPVSIEKRFFKDQSDFARINPKLVDGGVFDNQGIHKITAKGSSFYCPLVLISDAGNKLPFEQSYNNTVILLIRTVDVFMDRIKDFQMAQQLYRRAKSSNEQIGYQSLGWDLNECVSGFVRNMIDGVIPDAVIAAHGFDDAWRNDPEKFKKEIEGFLIKKTRYEEIKKISPDPAVLAIARSVGTNLTRLTLPQVNALAAHSDSMTELQLKLYCPEVVNGVGDREAVST